MVKNRLRILEFKMYQSPSTLERKARKSIDVALRWLEPQGITLERKPAVVHSRTFFPLDTTVYASVDRDEKRVVRDYSQHIFYLLESMYSRFGLKISRKVADQLANQAEALIEFFKKGIKSKADITLYNPVAEIKNLDELMVHEIWHLVEKQAELNEGDEIIAEGTATLVQYRFTGRFCFLGQREDLYETVATIIRHRFSGDTIPLKDLLDPSLRKKINEAADAFTRTSDRYRRETRALVRSSPYIEAQRKEILTNPAWKDFRNQPSAETYLQGLRALGDNLIAEELKDQDLTKLVEYGARLIKKR